MTLHETPMQDPNLGVQQIHVQLKNLCLEMQSLKQDRKAQLKVRKEVWCVKCKGLINFLCPLCQFDDWVLCRLFQRLNHSPGMLSCSQLEVPSPSATDVQRSRQKPAIPKLGSFSRVLLNEGPSMENLPSHATSDANNAAVSSAESTSSPQVVPHPLNSSESGSDSSMNWSMHNQHWKLMYCIKGGLFNC